MKNRPEIKNVVIEIGHSLIRYKNATPGLFNKALADEKKKLAKSIFAAIQPSQEIMMENKQAVHAAKVLLQAEVEHNELLKLKGGSPGRLGEIIKKGLDVIKLNFPDDFKQAEIEFKAEVAANVQPPEDKPSPSINSPGK